MKPAYPKNKLSMTKHNLSNFWKQRNVAPPSSTTLNEIGKILSSLSIPVDQIGKIIDRLAIIKRASEMPAKEDLTNYEKSFLSASQKFLKSLQKLKLIERMPTKFHVGERLCSGEKILYKEVVFPIVANRRTLPMKICSAIEEIAIYCESFPKRGRGRKSQSYRDLYISSLYESLKQLLPSIVPAKVRKVQEATINLLKLIGLGIDKKSLETIINKVKKPDFENKIIEESWNNRGGFSYR